MANRVYPNVVPNPVTPLGYDGANFRALLVDVTGRAIISPAAAPEIDTLGDHDLWYYDRYAEQGSDLAPPLGDYLVDMAVVPAGEVWQIRHIWCINNTNAVMREIRLVLDGAVHYLTHAALAAGAPSLINGSFVLAEGDNVQIKFFSVNAGDDLYWGAGGVKSLIA